MNFKEICRTCLMSGGTMFPLFSANVRLVDSGTATAKIVDLLKMFTKLLLSRNEGFPEQICSTCLDDIMRTYNFKLKCERSEDTWKQLTSKEDDRVCRTCLDASDSMFTLFNQIMFTIGTESASVVDLIKNFTKILISLDDEFPKWICKNCIDEMKIAYALKIKCETSERSLEAYLKETTVKAMNGNQIVSLNDMDISQLEFICMKEENIEGGMEAHENLIQQNEDCAIEEVMSDDTNATSSNQHQVIDIANSNMSSTSNSINQPQKVIKLDLLKLYTNSLLDQNFAIEEVIEDNMNTMTTETYDQAIMKEPIMYPNNIQMESSQEEIIEGDMTDSNLLMSQDCEIEEVVENDEIEQEGSDQFGESQSQFENDLPTSMKHETADATNSDLDSTLDSDDNRTEFESEANEEAYKCPGCSTMFLYNETLRKHIFENHTTKDLCMICNKAIYNSMWIHIINHIPKNHQCPECGKGFIAKSYVRSHLNNVHYRSRQTTSAKRFKCPECNEIFERKTEMHKHMLEHTNSYARCDCCKDRNNRNPDQSEPDQKKQHAPRKRYLCPICNEEFPHRGALEAHSMSKHSEEKSFKCTLCTSSFRLKGYLAKHIKNVHKKKSAANGLMETSGKS